MSTQTIRLPIPKKQELLGPIRTRLRHHGFAQSDATLKQPGDILEIARCSHSCTFAIR